jgi:RNA polymerase sigma factor (sigma-70 family)
MAGDSAIPPENLDEILAWLHPDPEMGAELYLQLREDLANIFKWRGFNDIEGLTDEVIDRVAKKLHEVGPTYVGDPRHYFRAVANNVAKEALKKTKTRVSLEGIDPADPKAVDGEEERAEDRDECLQLCLQKVTAEDRKLILGYYAKEKQAKIDYRSQLAQQFGMSVETLRVKVHRIRKSLQKCIEGCLKNKGER